MTRDTPGDWKEMNDPVIAEFRSNAGTLDGRQHQVILLTTTGAKTGLRRVTPLNFSKDGNRLVVIASKGGSSTHPSWYTNLVANSKVTVEYGGETFQARATTAEEPERTRLFDQQAQEMPFFAGFAKLAKTRLIPVVVFERLP